MNAIKYLFKMNYKSVPNISKALLILFIMLCLAGCKKADEPLNLRTTFANLTSEMTFKLDVTPNISGCIFESENEYIATVSSSGLITAHLVGETHITVTNIGKGFTAKCKVTVQPEHNFYKEPYLLFGVSRKGIKDYETRYLYEEADTSLLYVGENSSIIAVFYYLADAVYYESVCLVSADYPDRFEDFISERYYLLDTDNEFRTLMTPDSKTLVGIESGIIINSDPFYAVYYVPFPTSKSNELFKPGSDRIKGFSLQPPGCFVPFEDPFRTLLQKRELL
jgi:hypothetical protein